MSWRFRVAFCSEYCQFLFYFVFCFEACKFLIVDHFNIISMEASLGNVCPSYMPSRHRTFLGFVSVLRSYLLYILKMKCFYLFGSAVSPCDWNMVMFMTLDNHSVAMQVRTNDYTKCDILK